MRNYRSMLGYGVLFCAVIIIDRITKLWALNYATERISLNNYISFDLMFNRGFSWGMMHSASDKVFVLVTIIICTIMLLLLYYSYTQWVNNNRIFGEILVLGGAISNIADRFIYHGVIDFIQISINNYAWPVFNSADACIVIGALMIITTNNNEL